jgi:hypothetical protein
MGITQNYLKILILALLAFAIFSCESKSGNDQIKVKLEQVIDSRLDSLRQNFRHRLLSYVGEIISVDKVDSVFAELSINQDLELINGEILKLASSLNIEPLKIDRSADIELSVLLNELLILDVLIDMSRVSSIFESLRASVFVKQETKNEVEYNIGLMAYDEFFNPEIELITESDTFAINVNDDGFGYFTMEKKSSSKQHTFKGDVIIYTSDGSKKRLPFMYKNNSN